MLAGTRHAGVYWKGPKRARLGRVNGFRMGITGDSMPGARIVPKDARAHTGDDDWLNRVAQGACHDAGEVSEELLGDYLTMLAEAATSGARPARSELVAVRQLGRRAAETGVSAGHGVDLYLSAARRVW